MSGERKAAPPKGQRRTRFVEIVKTDAQGPSSDNPDVALGGRPTRLDKQATMGGGTNLTVRRARYAISRLSGLDKMSSARMADGDEPLTPQVLANRANQLERVTAADIQALREQLGTITRELLTEGFDMRSLGGVTVATMTEIALNKRAPTRDRVVAAKELGIISGLYATPKNEAEEAPQESEALRAEIAQKLKQLFGDQRFVQEAQEIAATPEPEPPKMPWD